MLDPGWRCLGCTLPKDLKKKKEKEKRKRKKDEVCTQLLSALDEVRYHFVTAYLALPCTTHLCLAG
jgi:hypothetical protein